MPIEITLKRMYSISIIITFYNMLKKAMSKNTQSTDKLLAKLLAKQESIKKLPALDDLEQAELDHTIALDHLYYSSKIEGTNLTKKQIDKAVHGLQEI